MLRNKFDFWSVHGIMSISGLVQSKWSLKCFMLTLQETWSIHGSMKRSEIEIYYIYILYFQSGINFQLTWLVLRIFWIKSDKTEVWNSQNTKFLRLTSWWYVFNVMQMLVNNQLHWMDFIEWCWRWSTQKAHMWAWLKSICAWRYEGHLRC